MFYMLYKLIFGERMYQATELDYLRLIRGKQQ